MHFPNHKITKRIYDVYQAEQLNHTVTEKRDRPYGRCYTFYPNNQMRENGIYYLKITM